MQVSGVLSLGVQHPLLGYQEPSWGRRFQGCWGCRTPPPRVQVPPNMSVAAGDTSRWAWVLTGVPWEQEAGVRRVPPTHRSRPKLSGERSQPCLALPGPGVRHCRGVSGFLRGGNQGVLGHGVPPAPSQAGVPSKVGYLELRLGSLASGHRGGN